MERNIVYIIQAAFQGLTVQLIIAAQNCICNYIVAIFASVLYNCFETTY